MSSIALPHRPGTSWNGPESKNFMKRILISRPLTNFEWRDFTDQLNRKSYIRRLLEISGVATSVILHGAARGILRTWILGFS